MTHMTFKINDIQRMTGDMFDWFEAKLTLTNGTTLKAFYDITEREFRLFYAEALTWPQRDDIRNKITSIFTSMLATESKIKS